MVCRSPSPPEDCSGIGGYELAVLVNDPSDPEHRDALDRFHALYGANADPVAIRPTPFDMDEINDRLGARFGWLHSGTTVAIVIPVGSVT